MEGPPFTELASDLLRRTRKAGHKLSKTQMARWHRAGLLRRPLQRTLGRGKGTETIYPFGTGDQLQALCEIHFSEEIRRLADIGWRMWWRGFPVDDKYWKPVLAKTATMWDQTIGAIAEPVDSNESGDRELTDEMPDRYDDLSEVRNKNHLFRQIRKRVGKKQFPTFLYLVLATSIGAFNGFYPVTGTKAEKEDLRYDKNVLSRSFAVNRTRKNGPNDINYSLEGSVDEVSGVLAMISRFNRNISLTKIFGTTSENELIQARNELWLLFLKITAVGHILEQTSGKTSSWNKIIRKIALNKDAHFQAALFLLWLVVRQIPSMRDGIVNLLQPEPGTLDTLDV